MVLLYAVGVCELVGSWGSGGCDGVLAPVRFPGGGHALCGGGIHPFAARWWRHGALRQVAVRAGSLSKDDHAGFGGQNSVDSHPDRGRRWR
jgi:hypothetical protein